MNNTISPIHGPLLQCIFSTNVQKYFTTLPFNCNILTTTTSSRASSFKCRSIKHENTSESHQGFSVLKTNTQCDIGSMWSSMGFYVFSIHIPLSFGGLSAAAKILRQAVLVPQVEALLVLAIQTLELSIVLLLLKYHGKPQYDLPDFFRANKSSKERSWLLASAVGFGFLLSLVFITSYIADRWIGGTKDVNNPFLKEILSSGSTSVTACTFAYCIITPLLEEVVYRGFLLTSLASKMKWPQAVAISSIVFSVAHLSGENFLQLVIVGFVLGCSYCWTGNLSSSIAIHSLYNALILFSTFMS
ncbi:hypothetical protein BUALT_Bualt18G0026300 [Buddleja alternifolia]|uniref:CAAX prenyl protease 2/Lysostaphin resistance protein A-like domain-containing protein n=1 Tax=Buddleja alternifolia TaxID=168488 RepID=A0AAV6W467_9LAMI|nr:hypothetical protein BUALT_Bualt18G0026300 [Buddleja alternifolia]